MSRRKAILVAASRSPTNNDTRPRRPAREHLQSSVLEELWSIWRADPRVPSVKSRRSWAISHNANPRLVDNWFIRRRTYAKKSGQPIPAGPYDLPPDSLFAPKRGQSTTSIDPGLGLEASSDFPSDDTLAYPPDDDDLNDLEASSDTVFDEDTSIELKRTETPAYKEVPRQSRSKRHQFQPKPSSVDPCATGGRSDGSFKNLSLLVCNQGRGKQSNFTCILCSTKSAQDDGTTSDPDSRGNSTIPCLRLDFRPDTLSELSAIPFLFCTPSTVPPDNAASHRNVDNWTIVEDKLGRLVNDGKLDFSFLDAPHLVSMELRD